ncbi:MAG: MATE family efflux transporter [Burkholderiaceae bacterium]
MSLLTGPILPTLLRLAAPNVLAMTMTVAVGIAETRYVGLMGTAPLAAMALVFPFAMLVQMMSAGAMGGGVSSAVSRALGAKDPGLLVGPPHLRQPVAGLLTTVAFLALGPALYHTLGGRDQVLDEAVRYAGVLFTGATLIWLINTLASILRGTGDMRVPSVVLLGSAVLQIALGGALGLGLGPMPAMGMPGVAIGQIVATGVGVAVLVGWLSSGRARLVLSFRGVRFRAEMFADILKVGALACLSPVQSVLTVLIFTGLVARLGVDALAGYGIGQRLEFLLIPIAFGIGVASVPMVGMAVGAGDIARARRVAWTAASVSAVMLGALGAVVSIAPDVWARLFTNDPAVLEHARSYLRWAGPAFAAFGFGLTLYFASQGSGRVLGPVLAATLRLVVVAGAGAWLAARDAQAWQYFALVAAGMAVYGVGTALAVKLTPWGTRRPPGPQPGAAPAGAGERPAPASR